MRANKTVYVYEDNLKFIGKYNSINNCSSSLSIPKTTIVKYIDILIENKETKTLKARRVYSSALNVLVFFKSKPIKNIKK